MNQKSTIWREPKYSHPKRCPHCDGTIWEVDDDGYNEPEWFCFLCSRSITESGGLKKPGLAPLKVQRKTQRKERYYDEEEGID